MIFSGYRTTDILFEGPRTQIFRGFRLADQLPVVIKALRSEHPPLRFVARLRHEYQLHQRFDDDRIVRALAYVGQGTRAALILEDFGGRSLRDHLRPSGLDLEQVLFLACRLAAALVVVHRAGILHKDIKPANVIFNPESERVALTDFSVSSAVSSEDPVVRAPEVLEGSLSYMSPEQTGRINRPIDARSDLYSFGVTLYELLTGRKPFSSQAPSELIHSHIARRPLPPDQLRGDLPAVVSEIVMRLLEKNADARYQSAAGLLADLETVRQASQVGSIVDFPLGTQERRDRLQLSSTLVGRDAELDSMIAALDRCCRGGNELFLLSGRPGIGKSALVRELQRSLVERRGAIVIGKCDAVTRTAPYAALAQSLRQLIVQILGFASEAVEAWRQRIAKAVGRNGQLIINLVPELEGLLGSQPAVPAMPMAEAKNRFHLVLRNFICACAREEHPLAIALEDLHWADVATLELIEDLVSDSELAYTFWIGTYRESEVSPGHPVAHLRDELNQAQAPVREQRLQPLSQAAVGQIVAATLNTSSSEVQPLIELVHLRSEGNPLFIRALLETMYEHKILGFDPVSRTWFWDLKSADAAIVPDDIAELVSLRVEHLSAQTQFLLGQAAGLGGRFEIHLLSRLTGQAPTAVVDALMQAVEMDLVRPIGDDYKFVGDEQQSVVFAFTHDRIQQAAYAGLEAEQRQRLHLETGRLLAAKSINLDDASLFEIAGHYTIAAPLVVDVDERKTIAAAMLRAGERARMSTAYSEACHFLQTGVNLLGDDPWRDQSTLIAALMREQFTCEYLAGRAERAIEIFTPLYEHTHETIEKARLYILYAELETTRGEFAKAITVGRRGLAVLGCHLPVRGSKFSVLQALVRFEYLRRRAPKNLAQLPPLCDPAVKVELRLLMSIAGAAYFADNLLGVVLWLLSANRTLEYGICDLSAYGLVGVGAVLATFGRHREAGQLLEVAHSLNDRFQNTELAPKLDSMGVTMISSWTQPLVEGCKVLHEAEATALSNGDLFHVAVGHVCEKLHRMHSGAPLREVLAGTEQRLLMFRRFGLRDHLETLNGIVLECQLLASPAWGTERDKKLLAQFTQRPTGNLSAMTGFLHNCYLARYLFLRDDLPGALLAVSETNTYQVPNWSNASVPIFRFWESLILARTTPKKTSIRRANNLRRIKASLRFLKKCAALNPSAYSPLLTLVDGELARLRGEDARALVCYNRAIVHARQSHALHIEGVAAESALRFAVERDLPILARAYLTEAINAYRSWGAEAKVHQLSGTYRQYMHEQFFSAESSATGSSSSETRVTSTVSLDLETVINAARAISGELAMDSLLSRLATLLVEHAGARRGVLMLKEDGELRVEAQAEVTEDGIQVEVGLGRPLQAYSELPHSILNRVSHTHEDIVLTHASQDPVYAGDRFFARSNTRSLLCIPILQQASLIGVLYLENDLVEGVFTHRRLALVKQLAAHMAISLTNARLYNRLNDARVAALAADRVKTRFLMNMSHELRTPLNAIIGFGEMIAENFQEGDTSDLEEDLQSLLKGAYRLLRSVSSILELTQMETDAREVKLAAIDLGELLKGLLGHFEEAAHARENVLRLDIPASVPPLTSDEHMLRYILTTLIDNACRFSRGSPITVRVAPVSHRGEPWFEISVADHGDGISQEEQALLFTAFYQVDDSPSRRYEGTGVSLAVSADFCRRLGGDISVESKFGEGSTFTVRIPEHVTGPGSASIG